MASEYKSPFSVGKRQTVYLDPKDPRVRGYKYGMTASRMGAEIVVVGADGLWQSGLLSNLKNRGRPGNGKDPLDPKDPNNPIQIGAITNLAAEWEDLDDGPCLKITFDFNFDDELNKYVTTFQYYLTAGTELVPEKSDIIVSQELNKTSVSQTVKFKYSNNIYYFGEFRPDFLLLEIAAFDSFGNNGPWATLEDIPTYIPDLCTPEITVTSIPMGYSVALIDVCSKPYEYISVEEVVSDAGTAPTSGYQQVYLDDIKPANIMTPTTEARWVKARYTSKSGLYGSYSNAVKVTPTNPVSADLIPPAEVSSVSAAWSGDNIVVSYTLPATDAGARFQVGLTAPNSSVGYFYAFPSGSFLNQTFTITKADLFAQFGSHFSSYSGVFKSIDAADNKSNGVSFTVSTRANPLTGITPTFTTTALVNGYNISYTLPAGAVYAEIYQKYTSWSGVTPVDSFTGTYSSGGASGTNTVTLSGVVDEDGASVTTIPTGYIVAGEGIPANTYITSVSGNEITVNNNFTSQVSGSITGHGIVYSGTSPANISSTIYENTYIIIRYYDDFENPSNYSAEQVVVPLSPVTVDTTGPGNVSAASLDSTSGIDNSGTLGFNGYVDLSWEAVTESSMRGYRIRFTTDTVDPIYSHVDYPIDQSNIPTGTLSYRLGGLAVGATYYIGIATYDQYNNTSTSFEEFDPVTISGTPAITDYITAGNFQFGQGVDPSNTTGITGTKRGLYFDDSNYWFLNSSDSARLKVGGTTDNYLLWDGSDFTIDGNIIAQGGEFAGNVELTTAGASIYSGDVTTSPGNLTGDGFIFNVDGLLIRQGSNQVSLDTATGGITANYGNIAGWVLSSSKIEKLDATTTKYAGISSTGFYKFYSGSTVSGGDTTQFAVDRTGKMYASSAQISGGTLDVGPSWPSGFHVDSSGNLKAASAIINGEIQATSGEISGNLQIKSTGSFYTGNGTTSSVVINTDGLAALNSSGAGITEILTTPITSGTTPQGNSTGGTLPVAINFFTKGALIGGWVISDSTITDRSQQFILDSTNNRLSIFGTDSGTNYGIILSTGANFLEAGTRNISNQIPSPNVYITKTGILHAVGGRFSGTVVGTNFYIGADETATNKILSNGVFSLGGGILTGTSSSVTINGGEVVIDLTGTVESDSNNFAGDPTLTLNPVTSKMTLGRRFIFNGSSTPSSSVSLSGGYGTWTTGGGYTTTVKVGDILMVS